MNLDYLKSFFVIVESNSISKAAKKLHLTQPGLSMQLQNLENEIGAKLLNRSNKGVELTEEGRIVYDQARTILSIEQNIRKDIKEIKNKQNIISLSSCNSMGKELIPNSIFKFSQMYPELKVSLNVENTCFIVKKLMTHEINIAIITDEHNYDDIESIPLIKDDLVLVANPKSKIDSLDLEELKKIPMILRNDASCTKLLLLDFIEPVGLGLEDLNIVIAMNSPDSIISTIKSSGGYAFLPSLSIKDSIEKGELKVIPVKGLDTSFNYHFAYRKGSKLTEAENKFKEFITSKDRGF